MTKYTKLTISRNPAQTIPEDRLVRIQNFHSIKDTNEEIMITRREFGEFAMKAVWLDDKYDWVLGRDNKDALILVPMKKVKD